MIIYRISNKLNQIEVWLNTYIKQAGGAEACIYGGCIDLTDSLYWALGKDDPTWERWGLWSFYEKDISDKLPLIVTPDELSPFLKEGEMLGDIAWEHHDVSKLQGYYWDGRGKHNSLLEINEYFDKVPNAHWLRTE